MFQKDFIWGVGASAYQIEGAVTEDGKGSSVWDEFSKIPGKVFEGHTGETASDHYHRYKEDIAYMKDLGVQSFRMSLSWTRIMPDGTGRVEKRGVEHYRDVIKELKKNGIRPFLAIFVWDYPTALWRKGGWLNPDSPKWFEEYTKVVAEEFGDLLEGEYLTTFNEPEMMFGNTFVTGNLAPGVIMSDGDVIRMIHNMLIAHGLSVKVLREKIPTAKVGITLCSDPVIPPDLKPETLEACRNFYFRAGDDIRSLTFGLSWYNDPVCLGTYPEDGLKNFGKYLPEGWEQDLKIICQPLDWLGHNLYTGVHADVGETGEVSVRPNPVGYPQTQYGWTIYPECMYWGPRNLYERYHLPIFLTENGMACHDGIALDGRVHDPNRIDYTHRYLLELKRAAEDGIDIRGYFHWSLLDNYEWASGFSLRFGLLYVNYQTCERTPKDSFWWYQKVIKSNGECLSCTESELILEEQA